MVKQEIRTILREVMQVAPPAPPVALAVPDPPVMAPPAPVPPPVVLVAPVAPHKRVIDKGRVTVFHFLNFELPTFSGVQGKDLSGIIEKVDRVVKHLSCSEACIIELMGLQSENDASKWYGREIDGPVHSDNPYTWEEFKEKLLDEYLTEGLRERNLVRFEMLKQEEKSVTKYVKEFCQFSKFARGIAPDDAVLIRRFRRGLNANLHNALLATEFTSLAKLIDKATEMEGKSKEERQSREPKRTSAVQQSREGGSSSQSLPPRPPYRPTPTQSVQSYTVGGQRRAQSGGSISKSPASS